MLPIILSAVAGGVALLFAVALVVRVSQADQGNAAMIAIAQAIKEGALAFLRREYITLVPFVAVVAVALWLLIDWYTGDSWVPRTAIAYLAGTLCSAAAGFIGMSVAIRANVRTTAAAMRGLNPALRVAFSSGAVMGITVVGVGLLGVIVLYVIFQNIDYVIGFAFGASSIALFARVGGGIYTKAADVGADLVGKVEAGIPEDDPRNPAVIADNVGDNVGDVAGMGADLFESYVGSIIAAIALAAAAASFGDWKTGHGPPAYPDSRRGHHRVHPGHLRGQERRAGRLRPATVGAAKGHLRVSHTGGYIRRPRRLLVGPGRADRAQRQRLRHLLGHRCRSGRRGDHRPGNRVLHLLRLRAHQRSSRGGADGGRHDHDKRHSHRDAEHGGARAHNRGRRFSPPSSWRTSTEWPWPGWACSPPWA